MNSSNKDKKSKQRFLSPRFKKNGIKDTKEEEGGFKIDLMWAGGEEDEPKSPSPQKKGKRHSLPDDKKKTNEKTHFASVKFDEQDQSLVKVNALPDGHVKKVASRSQAGKGEDGFTKVNQDSFLVIQNEYKLSDFNIFSVMDGHGSYGHLV